MGMPLVDQPTARGQHGAGKKGKRSMKGNLEKGHKYDVGEMTLLYWQAGSKVEADLPGYSLFRYFDKDGRYLGPDVYGVEPVVDHKHIPSALF